MARYCCSGRCFCDALKLIVPLAWLCIASGAATAYIVAPLVDSPKRDPRWLPAAMAAASGLAAMGASVEIWTHWTAHAYMPAGPSGGAAHMEAARKLRLRSLLLLGISLVLVAFTVLVGVVGSDLGICGHDSCGADVSWLLITLAFMSLWTALPFCRARVLAPSGERNGTAAGVELHASPPAQV